MANLVTKKEYDDIKNETYAIFKFTKDGHRVAYIRATFYGVMKELVELTKGELITIVVNEKDLTPEEKRTTVYSKNIEDFDDIIRRHRTLF